MAPEYSQTGSDPLLSDYFPIADHPETDASERSQISAEASCWSNDVQLAAQPAISSRGVVF
jgi:hypothetical protein